MGKKNKKAKSVAAESDSGMPRHVRREVLEIVNQLLDSENLACFSDVTLLIMLLHIYFLSLQCFDAVGWAAGRASGL